MKATKAVIPVTDSRIWCEYCCIRIAPLEERTAVGSKTYHPHCFSKLLSSPKPKV
jgi:hypothetical protein